MLFEWFSENRRLRKAAQITREFDPLRRQGLRMKFKFAGWTGNALEELEQVKCLKVDSS
jgi:hypothetical protein